MTRAQTLAALAKTYLHDADPKERVPPKRVVPPTEECPEDRYVPADVRHEIDLLLAEGGLCEFGGCERPGVEMCHLVPHADGSPREVTDLVRGCHGHHDSFDDGVIRFADWTKDGLPVFYVPGDSGALAPKPRPTMIDGERYPEWLLKAMGPSARRKLKRKRAWDADEEARGGSSKGGDPPGLDPPADAGPPTDGGGLVRDRSRPPPARRRHESRSANCFGRCVQEDLGFDLMR